jgi:hypothetical protein
MAGYCRQSPSTWQEFVPDRPQWLMDSPSGPQFYHISASQKYIRQHGSVQLMWRPQSMGFAHVIFFFHSWILIPLPATCSAPLKPFALSGNCFHRRQRLFETQGTASNIWTITNGSAETERDLETSCRVKVIYMPANTTFPKSGDWLPLPIGVLPKEKKQPSKYTDQFSDKRKNTTVSNLQTTKNADIKHTGFFFWSKHASNI